MNCRACSSPLSIKMIDLGAAPPSNAFNASQDVLEEHYPLRVWVCMQCGLAQTDITMFKLNHDELFVEDYPYYSSTSAQWVEHARRYVEQMTYTLNLNQSSLTVEVGCNDGYLLQWMTTPCYGIEPTGTAARAREHGLTVLSEFFGQACGRALARSRKADLMVCNNVLAHVPDVNDFVRGFAALLKHDGVATFEFPHLLNLITGCQFDTIYHEHYSYLSLTAVVNLFKRAGLHVFGVEKLATHGGSLRVHAQHEGGPHHLDESVVVILAEEKCLVEPAFYAAFQAQADRVKNDLLFFLLQARALGQIVVGFGAAAKANTLLNYAGIRSDLIPYVVDETPAKHGKFMPGSRIPVVPEFGDRPDYVIVFPWNFREEITAKLGLMRAAGTRLVFAIPRLEIV
jgi:SAM-dependent methyltransferase